MSLGEVAEGAPASVLRVDLVAEALLCQGQAKKPFGECFCPAVAPNFEYFLTTKIGKDSDGFLF